jgi:heme/copper-type cytochrome/quinol oxidase subunit 3
VQGRRPLWDLAHAGPANARSAAGAIAGAAEGAFEKSAVAVWAFVASEGGFFLILILAYLYFNAPRAGADGGAAPTLDARSAGLFTACLLASSFAAWRAEKALARAERSGAVAWLAATVLLGVLFLAGQAREYVGLWQHGVTVSSDLFATTFFTLTGFHGLHVAAGLVALTVALGLVRSGDCTRERPGALRAIGVYWHFVDAVWLVVFSLVYVRPLL